MIWDARLFLALQQDATGTPTTSLIEMIGSDLIPPVALALLVVHVIMYWVARFRAEKSNGPGGNSSVKIQCPLETQTVLAKLSDQVLQQGETQRAISKAIEGQNAIMDRLGLNQKLVISMLADMKKNQREMLGNQLDMIIGLSEIGASRQRRRSGSRSMGGGSGNDEPNGNND